MTPDDRWVAKTYVGATEPLATNYRVTRSDH